MSFAGHSLLAQRPRVHSLRAALLILVAGAVLLTIPYANNVPLTVLVLLLCYCCFFPAWIQWQRRRLDIFETIHLIGLLYFVFFGLGAIWAFNDPVFVAYDIHIVPYLIPAVLCCLMGYVALLGGYYGPWFQGRVVRTRERHPRTLMFVALPALLGFVGCSAEAVWNHARWLRVSFPTFISSLAQLAPLYQLAWALGWMLVLSGRLSRRQNWLLMGLLIPATVGVVFATIVDKSLAMSLAGIPLVALWYARGRVPWVTLIVLLLILIFVVFPFVNTYRFLDARIPQATRMQMTSDLLLSWTMDEYVFNSADMFMQRLALINSVAIVVRDVPRWIPYARGETMFGPALGLMIPRFLWPGKPSYGIGREFGEIFRVVSMLDNMTSIAATVPGELYWNFDLPGVLVGMALWGVLLRFLYRRYGEADGADPVRRAIHIVLLVQFAHFGGSLAAQMVTVVRSLILFEAYLWFGQRIGLLELRAVRGVFRPSFPRLSSAATPIRRRLSI